MNKHGLALIILVCSTTGAWADCKSETDKFSAATVVYRCPPSEQPVNAAESAVQPGNISVIKRSPEPEPPRAEEVGMTAVAAEPPYSDTRKAKSTKQETRKAARHAKAKRAPSKTPKKARVIHLTKPNLGRRVMQYLGL